MILVTLLISTLVLAGVWSNAVEEAKPPPEKEMWIPTKEDIAYQDSMYTIIQHTQQDVDTIKVQVQQIIKRLDEFHE